MPARKEPMIATEKRRFNWYWRFEYVKGYLPWNGPYPTEAEALKVAKTEKKQLS